ncbi:MAG: GTP-binding protein, partial [Ignisphaera sp.]
MNTTKRLRQPIVVVLGHVDHGKTTLLDKIRGTAVVKKEAGEMTQHIGASNIPISVIEKVIEPLKKIIPIKLTIPGLLFIDTPGHELFSNLRKRGGSVADIAILVIDINEGVMPQTLESIEILRSRKVPFVIAANKIDKIPGWKPNPDTPISISLKKQDQAVVKKLDNLLYKLIAQLSNYGISADLFERIRDFLATVPIVPVSAKTGEGIAELLAV